MAKQKIFRQNRKNWWFSAKILTGHENFWKIMEKKEIIFCEIKKIFGPRRNAETNEIYVYYFMSYRPHLCPDLVDFRREYKWP